MLVPMGRLGLGFGCRLGSHLALARGFDFEHCLARASRRYHFRILPTKDVQLICFNALAEHSSSETTQTNASNTNTNTTTITLPMLTLMLTLVLIGMLTQML